VFTVIAYGTEMIPPPMIVLVMARAVSKTVNFCSTIIGSFSSSGVAAFGYSTSKG
jgi:hypothetical protein